MQDATEGGGLPQYVLALRNKLFGYDTKKEGAKLDPKRFKSKAQVDELTELGDLKKLAAQISPQQKKLIDDKLKKEKAKLQQAQIAKSKPKNVRGGGVKPSTPPKPRVVYGPPAPKKKNVRGGGSSTKTPSFSASNPNGHRSKQETLGLMR